MEFCLNCPLGLIQVDIRSRQSGNGTTYAKWFMRERRGWALNGGASNLLRREDELGWSSERAKKCRLGYVCGDGE